MVTAITCMLNEVIIAKENLGCAVGCIRHNHAAEHLSDAGKAVFGADSSELQARLTSQCHMLRHATPDDVLTNLSEFAAQHPDQVEAINAELGYLTKRVDEIRYAEFARQSWPIGSGAGESAHKTVLQARMKRAGMRWHTDQVNPMLAMRNLYCSDRWHSDWPRIVVGLRQTALPPSAPTEIQPRLPPDFKLRPAVLWRNQPVGRAMSAPSPTQNF